MSTRVSIGAAVIVFFISPLSIDPVAAGGYVAPILEAPPIFSTPTAPVFTLCGEPVVCAGLAMALLGFLIQAGSGGDSTSPSGPPPPQPPDKPPIDEPVTPEPPEITPVPLPTSAPLLLGGLAVAALFRRRRRSQS